MRELEIAAVCHEPNDALRVTFSDESRQPFHPGQHVYLEANVGGERLRRSYSICSGPDEPLAVVIKRIEGGQFSNFAHQSFRTGERVQVSQPRGRFCPTEASYAKRYLLVAAGSGITPIAGIAKGVLAANPQSQVTLVYASRTSSDIILRNDLLWLKNRYLGRLSWMNVLSRESQNVQALSGRIDIAKLNGQFFDALQFDEYFVCGPQPMIADVTAALRVLGVAPELVRRELFHVFGQEAVETAKAAAPQAQMLIKTAGREHAFALHADGQSILDAALAQGAALPFSCKAGVCATCKARVLDGEVAMRNNHALSAEELAAGFVLTCQAHPVSDAVTIDFDVI